MTIELQIRDEKLQYDIIREVAKISALSSGKISKYEYLTGEEILSSNQQQIFEQAKFTYSPLGEAFENQTKAIQDQRKKQIRAIQDDKKQLANTQELTIKNTIPKDILSDEAKRDMNKIVEIEKTVVRENFIYRAREYTYSSKDFPTIKTFGRDIYNVKITLKEADNDQENLLVEIMNVKKLVKPKNPDKKQQKRDFLKNLYIFFEGRETFLDAFESKIIPIKTNGCGYLNFKPSNLKILTSKQMLQRLLIALAQIKAGNNSESLLNEIRQIVYSFINQVYQNNLSKNYVTT